MKSSSAIFVNLLILTLSACTQQGVDIEAERAALLAAANNYHETTHRSEWSRLIESDADDVIILPPNSSRISGLEEAKAFFAAAPDIELRYGDMIADVSSSGDMGYTLTNGVVTFEGPDGNRVEDKIRDFHLWKKQQGEWKIAVDMWSSKLPAARGAIASDVNAIKNTFAGLVAVAEGGNADGWFDYITDDAVYLLPGFSPIVGAEAIRDFVKDFLKDWSFSFPKWTIEEITVSGDLAIFRYSGTAIMTSQDGSESISEDRKYIDVYRKGGDGHWLLARHMYNLNQ